MRETVVLSVQHALHANIFSAGFVVLMIPFAAHDFSVRPTCAILIYSIISKLPPQHAKYV